MRKYWLDLPNEISHPGLSFFVFSFAPLHINNAISCFQFCNPLWDDQGFVPTQVQFFKVL